MQRPEGFLFSVHMITAASIHMLYSLYLIHDGKYFLFRIRLNDFRFRHFTKFLLSCWTDHLWSRPAFSHNTLLQLSLLTKMADNSSVGFRLIPICFTNSDQFWYVYQRIIFYRLRLWRAVASPFSGKTRNTKMNGVSTARLLSRC